MSSIALHLVLLLLCLLAYKVSSSNERFVSQDQNSLRVVNLINYDVTKQQEQVLEEEIENREDPSREKSLPIDQAVEQKKAVANQESPSKSENNIEQSNNVLDTSLNNKEIILSADQIEQIEYDISNNISPRYPEQAKKFRISNKIIIKTRMLINKHGNIENIEFLDSNIHNQIAFLFHKEIISAISRWKISQVIVDNTPVEIFFYKDFLFVNNYT